VYGDWVRPLPRTFKGKVIAATPPDRVESWQTEGRTITAQVWDKLVLPGVKLPPQAKTFQVDVIHDPAYPKPWLLATPLSLRSVTVKAIYTDRWPVEQLPLAAKQRVSAHRQFVHDPESIQRLPKLALLAGSILSFLAATIPVTPTGFRDTQPKRTPWPLAPSADGPALSTNLSFARPISKKGGVHRPFTQRDRRASPAHRSCPILCFDPYVSTVWHADLAETKVKSRLNFCLNRLQQPKFQATATRTD